MTFQRSLRCGTLFALVSVALHLCFYLSPNKGQGFIIGLALDVYFLRSERGVQR
jgi:hypothetical protein